MISYKDYIAGWLNMSMSDFLNVFPVTSEKLKYSLITCVDSNTNPVSLLQSSRELKLLSQTASRLGQGVCVPTKSLLEVRREGPIFYGFDELWFFPSKPSQPKPDTAWLVGPERIKDQTLGHLGSWMNQNSCSLALGGGTGLNFVIKARGLVKYLIGFSIEQPSIADIMNSFEYE